MSRAEAAATSKAYAPDMASIKAIDAEWQSCEYNSNLTRHLFITIDCSLTSTFALDKIYEIQLATTSGISLGSNDSIGIYASTLRSLIEQLGGDPNAIEKNPLVIGDFFLMKKRMRLFLEQQTDLKKHNPTFMIITPSQMGDIRHNTDDHALHSFYEKIKTNQSTAIIKFEETRGRGNFFLSDISRYGDYEQFKQYFIEVWSSSVSHSSAVASRADSFDGDDVIEVFSVDEFKPTSDEVFLLEECSNASIQNNIATTYRIAILATVMPGADEAHPHIHTAFMPIRGEIHTGYNSHHPIYWESFFDKLQYFYDTEGKLTCFKPFSASQNQAKQCIQTSVALKLQLEALTSSIVRHCHENRIRLNGPFTTLSDFRHDTNQHFLFPCSEFACRKQEDYTDMAFQRMHYHFFNYKLEGIVPKNDLIGLYAAIPEYRGAKFFIEINFERVYAFVRALFSYIDNESLIRAYAQYYLDNPDEFKKTLDGVVSERRTATSAAAAQSGGLLARHNVISTQQNQPILALQERC